LKTAADLATNKDEWDFDYNNDMLRYNTISHMGIDELSKLYKQKVTFFEQNKCMNFETTLEKKYNLYSDKTVDLTLSSIKLQFVNQTKVGEINVMLPLSLLPVFYYALYDIENFKRILSITLKFNKTFSDIEFNMEEMDNVIRTFPEIFQNKNYNINDFRQIPNKQRIDWITEFNEFEVTVK